MPTNHLYYGDNLEVLRYHLKDESVDLIYLDPPFKSNRDYNVLFQAEGVKSAAQIQAWGQACLLPIRESGRYPFFKPLTPHRSRSIP